MTISGYYTIALEFLLICHHYSDTKVNSNMAAKLIGADPVLVRQAMIPLKRDGYIDTKPGPGSTLLLVDLKDITLYDIYKSVTDGSENVLKCYPVPETATPFEANFINIATNNFTQYMVPFFEELKQHTLKDLYDQIISTL